MGSLFSAKNREVFSTPIGMNNPATIQQMLIEPLQVQRSEACQRDVADLRLDVVFQKALRGFEGRWTEFHLGVVLHPHFQPCSHRVGLGPSVVDADVFLYGFLQLLLDRSLRLSENIFDDDFTGFGIVTDCVAALPSSILALSDIALTVRSSFWHKIDLLCNGTQYRKRQRKAMGKPHYYQKVINSQPPLIFVYGVARFELLRRLPPTTTV